MNVLLRLLVGLGLGLILGGNALAGDLDAIPVPEGEYTVLNFGQPIAHAVVAPDAPIVGKPYYLSANRTLVIRFKPSKKPIQVIAELHDGTTRVLYFQPQAGADASVNIPGTAEGGPPQPEAQVPSPSRNPSAGAVAVLTSALSGMTPAGWTLVEATSQPKLIYDRLTATPVGVWAASGNDQVMVQYRLDAKRGLESVVDPSQFYRPGVVAALLSDSKVTKASSPYLYVIEKVH